MTDDQIIVIILFAFTAFFLIMTFANVVGDDQAVRQEEELQHRLKQQEQRK